MELFNLLLLIISRALVIDSSLARISGSIKLILELVSLVLDLVHLCLLREDLVAEGQRVVHSLASVETAARVLVFDLVDHQRTVIANSEQEVILVGEFHAHNRSTVGLHLREKLQGEFPDLDRSWVSLLTDSGKHSFSIRKDLDLADVVARVATVLMVNSVPDLAVRASHHCTVSRVRDVRDALDRNISLLQSKIVILAPRKIRPLKLQIVEVGQTVRAGVAEARVIFEPVDARNFATVAFALLVGWTVYCVEVEDRSDGASSSGKHVPTVTEPNLVAVLERHLVVVDD